jgi:hypothetical protein
MDSLRANRLNVSWLLRNNTMELEGERHSRKTAREAASEWSRRAARDIDRKTERSNGVTSEFQSIDKSFVSACRLRTL